MKDKFFDKLMVSSAPHIVTALDTQKTMMWVLIALIPPFIMSTVVFGPRVILMTAVCVGACLGFEYAYQKLLKREETWTDLSACVTGVLLAFNVPANLPIWMAILGSFIAIIVVKQLFGGIGRNFANPAIVGRIFLILSFTARMTAWPIPRVGQLSAVDAATGPTPLGILKETPLNEISSANLPSLQEMFFGFTGGSMGEVCALAILIGGIILIAKKIISPATPVAFIGTVFIIALIYYGVGGSDVSALHMALVHILSGGVMLGAFFMATDYVTSPIMPLGKVIMGIGCGFFTMIIRLWAGYPEGVSFAILLMNILTPLIDMLCEKITYGGAKKNG
jgi:electron transport complex protein RnfD